MDGRCRTDGRRQARYADLESGTKTIIEYVLALVPGLLQTTPFADARLCSDPARHADTFDPAAAVAAQTHRQLLLASDGPHYGVVPDDIAIRRCAAEPHILADQLRHITAASAAPSSVTVRVLPIDASISGHSAPRSAYSIYRYRDTPGSLALVVDTPIRNLILTESDEVELYLSLYRGFKAAALAPKMGIRLLHATAGDLRLSGRGHRGTGNTRTGASPPAATRQLRRGRPRGRTAPSVCATRGTPSARSWSSTQPLGPPSSTTSVPAKFDL